MLLGFSWRQHAVWEQHVHDLIEFKNEHGHCDVPSGFQANPALATWVSGVRSARKRGALAAERVRALNALGFRWVRKARKGPTG
jgi:hypothetical protein